MFLISDQLLENILLEDIPYGDATTDLLGIEHSQGTITCYPKVQTTVSGVTLAARLFAKVGLTVSLLHHDGECVEAGDSIMVVNGNAGALHAVYKTAQTIMEYCSGISTRTAKMVSEAHRANPHCQVVTTRKHFPGTKALSLYAAQAGGALVHRMGLSESILIFDQHRVFLTNPEESLRQIKQKDHERKIAIEANTLEEARQFVLAGADIIQCERFDLESFSALVSWAKSQNPHVQLSVAGGINATNAFAYAQAGSDFLVTTWPYFGRPMDIKMAFSKND